MSKMEPLDLILKIVQTAATLAIGIAASFLAYRQYKISRAKLKLDLYEKRLELFTKLRDFISEVGQGHLHSSEILDKTLKAYHQTLEHWFLFDDPAINAYFQDVFATAKELHDKKQEMEAKDSNGENIRDLWTQQLMFEGLFLSQTEALVQVFKNDLSIKTLK